MNLQIGLEAISWRLGDNISSESFLGLDFILQEVVLLQCHLFRLVVTVSIYFWIVKVNIRDVEEVEINVFGLLWKLMFKALLQMDLSCKCIVCDIPLVFLENWKVDGECFVFVHDVELSLPLLFLYFCIGLICQCDLFCLTCHIWAYLSHLTFYL